VLRLVRDDAHPVALLGHATLPVEGVQFHPESILTRHGQAIIDNFTACVCACLAD